MYEFFTPEGKDKYNGYFMKVTEYEKKIAEGIYNWSVHSATNQIHLPCPHP